MSDTDKPTFICEDCKDNVFVFGEWDGIAVCRFCRFIREHPELPESWKAKLRGGR